MLSTHARQRRRWTESAGYSLVELIISMGLMTLVMAVTLGGIASAKRSNDAVMNITTTNASLRAGMDLMVMDLLQTGSGLPPGHVIQIPSGNGSTAIRLPGPPGTPLSSNAGDTDIAAVLPSPGVGPVVNGIATDLLTILTTDNTFLDIALAAATSTTVDLPVGTDLDNGQDRVTAGQLMMISKGSTTTLLQVTAVDSASRRLTFATGDSLNLNQPLAAAGTLAALNAADPANTPSAARISRIRMITYYLDATTDPDHPRLVRRINNGHPTAYDNSLGNAVAIDVENLQFSYDLVNGTTNPSGVRMTADDLTTSGRCAPNTCSDTQIRKVDIALTGRSGDVTNPDVRPFRNTLTTQVSFRGMAFVDRYLAPQ